MEEPLPPLVAETAKPPSSLFARLTNVFIAPTEVFDEVKRGQPTPANWIVPLVLMILVGVVYTLVVFSQPGVLQQMKDAREKKFQEMVAAGKMPQAQADKMLESMDKFMKPGLIKALGCLSAAVANPALLFLTALIFWAVGRRAFHADFAYMKAVEVVGLAMTINVLGAIVAMLLAVIFGNMLATPGPVLLVVPLDSANKTHRILSALNVIPLWYVAVLSIGLSRLSGVKLVKAAIWLYGIWALATFVPLLLAPS